METDGRDWVVEGCTPRQKKIIGLVVVEERAYNLRAGTCAPQRLEWLISRIGKDFDGEYWEYHFRNIYTGEIIRGELFV